MNFRLPNADCRMQQRVAGCPLPVASRRSGPLWQLTTRNWQLRRGFTFTEILFAVMILGIGFIMVAAIFPVAIQQTEANNQETIAASIGRSTTGFVEKVAQGQAIIANATVWPPSPSQKQVGAQQVPVSVLVPTFEGSTTQLVPLLAVGQTMIIPGEVWTFREPNRDPYTYTYTVGAPQAPHWPLLWNGIARNLVIPSDPRFAGVVMYKRDLIAQRTAAGSAIPLYQAAPFAQVIVVGVEARNKQVYTTTGNQSDIVVGNNGKSLPTLVPKLFTRVLIQRDASRVSSISFGGNSANTPVAENAYVVVSRDLTFAITEPHQRYGHFNGRIFRIGNSSNVNGNTWELAPGSDLTDGDASFMTGNPVGPFRINADVLVVGRALDPNNPNQFTGLAQDVSVYSSYVQIPN